MLLSSATVHCTHLLLAEFHLPFAGDQLCVQLEMADSKHCAGMRPRQKAQDIRVKQALQEGLRMA